MQKKQPEWLEQWKMLQDSELFLFEDWIKPHTLEIFRNKNVLECGCGGGQHTSFVAKYASHITAVDLNTTSIARQRNSDFQNVEFIERDIATMTPNQLYDVVFSIGVIHHTDDPDKTVENLKKHLRPGGWLILWVYSQEGNWLVENAVEAVRKAFLKGLRRKKVLFLAKMITALMYIPVFSMYLLPLSFLPYFQYFFNFRRLSFIRNVLNVFDKLNAPQTQFISWKRAKRWVEDLEDALIIPYKGVSYSISGRKPSKTKGAD